MKPDNDGKNEQSYQELVAAISKLNDNVSQLSDEVRDLRKRNDNSFHLTVRSGVVAICLGISSSIAYGFLVSASIEQNILIGILIFLFAIFIASIRDEDRLESEIEDLFTEKEKNENLSLSVSQLIESDQKIPTEVLLRLQDGEITEQDKESLIKWLSQQNTDNSEQSE